LLQVPFASRQDRRALLAWLGGREPSLVDLERIGAQGAVADLDVMRALSTLTVAAAYGAPVVLVFDQLENLAEDGGRTERIHAHARLVSDLRDTVRGLVIVQMALEAEWVTRIHPALQSADRDRLEETVLHLALPTPEERLHLLQRWCEALPEHHRTRPFPHPFRSEDVEAWVKRVGMTPRMLMQAAHEAYLGGDDAAGQSAVRADPGERLQAHWDGAVAHARREIDDASRQQRGAPAERLAGGFVAALELSGAVAETVSTKSGPLLRVASAADQGASNGTGAEIAFTQHGLRCAEWPPISAALAVRSPEPEELGLEPPRTSSPVSATSSEAPRVEGPAHLVLQRLGVASIERVVREAKALDATVTRATAVAELRQLGVRFFGDSVVAAKELGP
jgi:hypothetical protein